MLIPLLVLLLLVAVVVAVLLAVSPQSRGVQARADQEELRRLRGLVDDLKELAWDHREIDPDLATILIERIRQSERRGRELP
jgi:hypothetical protein